MKTVVSSGPGFYAAATSASDPKLPKNKLRVYVARVEVYDLECDPENPMESIDANTQFRVLPSLAENQPIIADAMLKLYSVLGGNLSILKLYAKK